MICKNSIEKLIISIRIKLLSFCQAWWLGNGEWLALFSLILQSGDTLISSFFPLPIIFTWSGKECFLKVELVLIQKEEMLLLGRQKATAVYYRSLCCSEILNSWHFLHCWDIEDYVSFYILYFYHAYFSYANSLWFFF